MTQVIRTDPEMIGLPLTVSTSEPRFRTFVLGQQLRQDLSQTRRGNGYKELLGDALLTGGEGLELMGVTDTVVPLRATRQAPPATYQQWLNMSRSERRNMGLPVSTIGGEIYYNRFGVGAGFNNPETGLPVEMTTQPRTVVDPANDEQAVTYQEWLNMSRSERERRGLPVSAIGGQRYFNRLGVGLGLNDPETGERR
jgi:hypothetical protein